MNITRTGTAINLNWNNGDSLFGVCYNKHRFSFVAKITPGFWHFDFGPITIVLLYKTKLEKMVQDLKDRDSKL
jgi:hypothetical protein